MKNEIMLRPSKELHQAITELAKKNFRSRNAQILFILEQYLASPFTNPKA